MINKVENAALTPDHPCSRNPFSQLSDEMKKREMKRMSTQTTRLTPLRTLVTLTDFLTPEAKIAVIVNAMKDAKMSG